MVKQSFKNMTLKQAEAIRDNQYRSADNSQDYCPFSIEERIVEIKMKMAAKITGQEIEANEFDSQLAAIMSVDSKGKYLLSLIDYVLKTTEFSCSVEVESCYETNFDEYIDCVIYADVTLNNGNIEISCEEMYSQYGRKISRDINPHQEEEVIAAFWDQFHCQWQGK